MNITFSLPSNFNESLIRGYFDFDASNRGTMYLMRDGFSYRANTMLAKKNFSAVTGSVTTLVIAAASGGRTAVVSHASDANNFTTLGFVVGNYVTTSNTDNDGTYVVRSISDNDTTHEHSMQIQGVTEADTVMSKTTFTGTVTCIDEHATVGGQYTRGTGVVADFNVSGNSIVLASIDLTTAGAFGTAISDSPGFIICDNVGNSGAYPVIAYARFSTWAVSY